MSRHFNVFDQATLTELINRPIEKQFEGIDSVGELIAPLVPVQSREVKIQVADVNAFGKGQYRAPGATPALYEPSATLREEVIELALIDEMHRIKDEDFLALSSSDPNYSRKAGLSILERGEILALRNKRATEALRWEAFSGEATLTYPNGSQLSIDYGIPAANKPTAGTGWDDPANATVISDLKAWQALPANQVGFYGLKIHMSSQAWEYVLQNDEVSSYLTGENRNLLIPTRDDVVALLREGTEIVITDAGYRDEGEGTNRGIDSVTSYLPENYALITTEYVVDGERIADMPDGQVIVSNGYNSVDIRQGAQSEVILEHMSKTHFLRYASARIPRIRQPGAFVWAQLW